MSISITGLSGSGLDTTSLVEQLMEVERIPLKTLQSKKSNLESQQSVFRQLNTKLNALQYAMSDLNLDASFKINKGTSSNANIANVTTQTNATAGTYNVTVKQLAEYETRLSANSYTATGNGFISSSMKFSLNGNDIVLNPLKEAGSTELKFKNNKEVLENLVNEINRDPAKYKATAALMDIDGSGRLQLALTATEAKEASTVNFSLAGSQSTAITKPDPSNPNTQVPVLGKPAVIEINGVEVTRNNNNFDNIVSGISLTAKEVGTTQITVGKDTAAIAANVQKFVTAYNDVVDFVNRNIAKPTEEGAINPLQNDSVLKQLKNDVYNFFTEGVKLGSTNGQVSGPSSYMEEIGLKIDANLTNSSQFTGKITFDQAAFKTSLEQNPERVQGLFGSIMETGIGKIKDGYTEMFKGQISSKITGFDNQIKATDERLEIMNRSLSMKQARLKMQFNSMETMLLSLNNQSSWLKSQFEGLTKANSN